MTLYTPQTVEALKIPEKPKFWTGAGSGLSYSVWGFFWTIEHYPNTKIKFCHDPFSLFGWLRLPSSVNQGTNHKELSCKRLWYRIHRLGSPSIEIWSQRLLFCKWDSFQKSLTERDFFQPIKWQKIWKLSLCSVKSMLRAKNNAQMKAEQWLGIELRYYKIILICSP